MTGLPGTALVVATMAATGVVTFAIGRGVATFRAWQFRRQAIAWRVAESRYMRSQQQQANRKADRQPKRDQAQVFSADNHRRTFFAGTA